MRTRRGISVLQAVVVLFVVVIGVGVAITLISRQRENALRVQCSLNLKRIGDAMHAYHDQVGVLPASRIADDYATWAVLLAPYLTKDSALMNWQLEQSYGNQADDVRESRVVSLFCPARRRSETLSLAGDFGDGGMHLPGGLGDYACVAGDGSRESGDNGAIVPAVNVKKKGDRVVHWQSATGFASLERGLEYTILVGEKHVSPTDLGDAAHGDGSIYNGGKPASFTRYAGEGFSIVGDIELENQTRFGSWHRGVCHFLFADTSVRPMTPDTSERVLGAFARRGK